ncbi:FirrV-1-B35 [Feldmannia irregularis virus a]|uniref:FirrV-1-B35 n=1 Tax=Feldmannia irregularis virus a TaxID=231992 RepID=Q6XM01_9PHYC|nr:FirrV-1-B35 [Feldmannia irregularis virus a]AAR26910.1 FirrV-1-B35 [Feldmannia irregularis virus a]
MANHLPDPILMHIFLHHQPKDYDTLRELKHVCKSFRSALGTRSVVWNDLYFRYCNECAPNTGRLRWGKSVGTTALMLRLSSMTATCVSCGFQGRGFKMKPEKHPFYGVRLCGACVRLSPFRMESLTAMCQLFFLDRQHVLQGDTVTTIKIGRAFMLLFDKMKAEAERTYPNGLLKDKMDKREQKRILQSIRKIESQRKRIEDATNHFNVLVSCYSSRIDPVLQDQERLQEAVRYFSAISLLSGDFYDNKITSKTTPTLYAKKQLDFAELLTYMKKMGLLNREMQYADEDPVHAINPKYIFKIYVQNGLHFYDQVHQYAMAEQQLRARIQDVRTFINVNRQRLRSSTELRRQLCVSMCVEEGVDYCPIYFKDFVIYVVGNPCIQARRLRCFEFLTRNGHQEVVQKKISYGFSMSAAIRSASKYVLDQTNGFPVMSRACVIDLSPLVG